MNHHHHYLPDYWALPGLLYPPAVSPVLGAILFLALSAYILVFVFPATLFKEDFNAITAHCAVRKYFFSALEACFFFKC